MRQDLHAVLLLRANNLGFDATWHWNPTHDATQAEYDRFGSVGISTAGNQNPSKPSLPEDRIPVLLLYANDLGFCAIGAGFVEGRAGCHRVRRDRTGVGFVVGCRRFFGRGITLFFQE